MKQVWEYKKLGEIGTIVTGSTPSTKIAEYYSSNDYCFVKPSDLPNEGYKILKDSEYHISSKGFEVSRKLPKGTVLVSCIGIIGKTAILGVEACTNQQINAIIPNDSIDNKFLAYSILSQRYRLSTIANAPVVPLINKGDFSKVETILPPLSIQQSIVAELDEINNLIQLKKKELETFDKLAQSIFYEMFGDPVTNEKGWEVKKIIDVITLQRGFDLPTQGRIKTGKIPVYGSNGILDYHNESKLNEGIVTGRSGTIGKVYISKEPFWPLNTTLFSKDTHGNNLIYLCYLLQFFDLTRFVEGAGVPTLNRNNFHNKNIINVPLTLQQTFANRIEAIEQQKIQVKAAINKLETLLASRMQYWFD